MADSVVTAASAPLSLTRGIKVKSLNPQPPVAIHDDGIAPTTSPDKINTDSLVMGNYR